MMISKILRSLSAIKTPRTKLALIVRTDLKMSTGKTAAQTAHAAVLCFSASQEDHTKKRLLDSWYITGQPKIVLRVNSYKDIVSLEKRAKEAGLITSLVKDAGRTQLDPGTTTVLGIGPDTVERIDDVVAHLKLL